jgi:hypothetical protein
MIEVKLTNCILVQENQNYNYIELFHLKNPVKKSELQLLGLHLVVILIILVPENYQSHVQGFCHQIFSYHPMGHLLLQLPLLIMGNYCNNNKI